MQRRCAIKLVGKVQDVGLRALVAREARRQGFYGWVRNLSGGEVALEVEGEAAPVALFIAWLRAAPGPARPTNVEVSDIAPQGTHEFVIE